MILQVPGHSMNFSNPILRMLLALLIGLVPVLCCCGEAEASVDDAAADFARAEAGDAPHACCESRDDQRSKTPASDLPNDRDCGCDATTGTMQNAPAENAVVLTPPVELPCFQLAPLARPLALILMADPADDAVIQTTADVARLPAATTLRTLDVLLLT